MKTDGFDDYGTVAAMGTRTNGIFWRPGALGTALTSPGRFGGQAITVSAGSATTNVLPGTLDAAVSSDTFGQALLINASGNGGIDSLSIGFVDSSTATLQCRVTFNPQNGQISAKNGSGALIGQSPINSFPNNAYFYCEINVIISSTVGVIKVVINGLTTVLNLINVNTKNSSNSTFDTFQYSAQGAIGGNSFFTIDDWYENPPGFVGDQRDSCFYPTANGGTIQWSPSGGTNFSNVNSVLSQTANFNASNTPGQKDVFPMQPVPGGSTIATVTVKLQAAKSDATARQISVTCFSASASQTSAPITLSTGQVFYTVPFPTDPNTGLAWTPTALNAATWSYNEVV
jgi:hypothetical protein